MDQTTKNSPSSSEHQTADINEDVSVDLSMFATLASTAVPLPIKRSGSGSVGSDQDSELSSDGGLSSLRLPGMEEHGRRSSQSMEKDLFSFGSDPSESIFNRRLTHNICERKRRDHIRNGFHMLHQRVLARADGSMPTGMVRMSKMDILRGGIEKVRELKLEVAQMRLDLARLLQRQRLMAQEQQKALLTNAPMQADQPQSNENSTVNSKEAYVGNNR